MSAKSSIFVVLENRIELSVLNSKAARYEVCFSLEFQSYSQSDSIL
jgi:hypothetical protein